MHTFKVQLGWGGDVSISDFPYHFSLFKFFLVPSAKAVSQETSSGMLKLKVDFLKSAQPNHKQSRNDLLEQFGRD